MGKSLRLISTLLSSLLIIVAMGCASVHIQNAPTSQSSSSYSEYVQHWLFGFVGESKIDIAQACPDNRFQQIRLQVTGEDLLINIFSLGLYTSRSVQVTCAESASKTVEGSNAL